MHYAQSTLSSYVHVYNNFDRWSDLSDLHLEKTWVLGRGYQNQRQLVPQTSELAQS